MPESAYHDASRPRCQVPIDPYAAPVSIIRKKKEKKSDHWRECGKKKGRGLPPVSRRTRTPFDFGVRSQLHIPCRESTTSRPPNLPLARAGARDFGSCRCFLVLCPMWASLRLGTHGIIVIYITRFDFLSSQRFSTPRTSLPQRSCLQS